MFEERKGDDSHDHMDWQLSDRQDTFSYYTLSPTSPVQPHKCHPVLIQPKTSKKRKTPQRRNEEI